jgi:hypothetical protein
VTVPGISTLQNRNPFVLGAGQLIIHFFKKIVYVFAHCCSPSYWLLLMIVPSRCAEGMPIGVIEATHWDH